MSFVDGCIRCMWVYLMKSRDDFALMVSLFHKVVKTKVAPQGLRIDNASKNLPRLKLF